MGLPNPIVALENGTMGWELAGLTLERGASRWPPAPSPAGRALAAKVAKRVAAEDGVPLISADDVKALVARGDRENVYILDVRTADEYASSHIAGAVWAPGGQAVQATDEYVGVRAATVVLACDGFARSVMTAAWLRRMGLPNAVALAGGLAAWKQAGGAVESGHPSAPVWGWEEVRRRVRTIAPGPLGDAAVIDVDTSDVYARGHVPGATWMCRSRLELEIGTVAPDTARPVVVTCADGVQSTLAAVTLADIGYSAVRVLDGRHPRVGERGTSDRERPHEPRGTGRRRGAEALREGPRVDGGVPSLGGGARPARHEPARSHPGRRMRPRGREALDRPG